MFLDRNSHNALTDVLIRQALRQAIDTETKIGLDNKAELPLYGFVFSVSENVKLKGTASSYGLTEGLQRFDENSELIDWLVGKGAVILAKGNIDRLALDLENDNPLFGLAKNPFDQSRSAGGPCGGDACLVALN